MTATSQNFCSTTDLNLAMSQTNKVNYKVYPVAVITKQLYALLASSLQWLSNNTNCTITCNFAENYFDITANQQDDCQKAVDLICDTLLPTVNKVINPFELDGTFTDLDSLHALEGQLPMPVEKDAQEIICGRPLEADLLTDDIGVDDLTISEDEQEVEKIFTISPELENVEEILIGPPQWNMLPAEYLDLVPMTTGVECAVISNTSISIVGEPSAVARAYNFFEIVQRIYLGQKIPKLCTCPFYEFETSPGLFSADLMYYHKLRTITQNFHDALTAVKAFKGEIKLSVKLGRVLWLDHNPRLKNSLTKSHSTFNTIRNAILGTAAVECATQKFHEFHCVSRNSTKSVYTKTVMTMKVGSFWFNKVIISDRNVAEANIATLNCIFDGAILLNTKTLTRTDVKPFKTFARTISYCPSSGDLTFSNIPRYLFFKQLLLKKVHTFKNPTLSPFEIDIVRTERVPISTIGKNNFVAHLGHAKDVTYDVVLHNPKVNAKFKSNLNLGLFEEATWEVPEILAEGSNGDTIHSHLDILFQCLKMINKALVDR